jgi:hypothetical protein
VKHLSRAVALASAVVSAGLDAAPALAQALTTREAQATLFSTRGTAVVVSDALSAGDQDIMRRTIGLLEEQLNGPVKYYATIAYSPDQGLLSDALQSAMNYHTVAGADAAALAACNAARAGGTQPCQIAARVLPRGYESRPLTLSYDATSAFGQVFRRAPSPKVFAVSESTGAYAIGPGAEAALATCRADRPGAADCRVVISD